MAKFKGARIAVFVSAVIFGFTAMISNLQQLPDIPDIEFESPVLVDESVYLDPNLVSSKELYTFTCEITVQKPEELIEACGDGGVLVHSIKWNLWEPSGARGIGTFSANQCEPSCAEGVRLEAQVKVSLSDVIQWKGRFYLVNLDVTPVNPSKVPAQLNPHGWDVSEFARVMDW